MSKPKPRIAIYERVASGNRRDWRAGEERARRVAQVIAVHSREERPIRLYFDKGISGNSALQDRRQGRRLLEDAASGRIDEVWLFSADRLARSFVQLDRALERLCALGVRVFLISGAPFPRFLERPLGYVYEVCPNGAGR